MEELQGEQDMVTLSVEMERAVDELIAQNVDGESIEIPKSDGRFVLVRVGSEAHKEAMERSALIFQTKDDKFIVCTK